jgi:hypothetical protein
MTPTAARSRIIVVEVVESLLTPPGAFACGDKSRLPSSFCHNFSFFSLFSLALTEIHFNS